MGCSQRLPIGDLHEDVFMEQPLWHVAQGVAIKVGLSCVCDRETECKPIFSTVFFHFLQEHMLYSPILSMLIKVLFPHNLISVHVQLECSSQNSMQVILLMLYLYKADLSSFV